MPRLRSRFLERERQFVEEYQSQSDEYLQLSQSERLRHADAVDGEGIDEAAEGADGPRLAHNRRPLAPSPTTQSPVLATTPMPPPRMTACSDASEADSTASSPRFSGPKHSDSDPRQDTVRG